MNELAGLIILFVPLFLIIWLANLAEHNRTREMPHENIAIFSYALVVLLYIGAFMVGIGQVNSLPLAGMGIWIPALLGPFLLTPFARRLVARLLPIDPSSPVHAVALALTMLVVINLMATLGMGLGNLSEALEAQANDAGGIPQGMTIFTLWIQQIITALWALVGVGWALRRNWGQSLRRVGVVALDSKHLRLGIGIGLAMLPVVMVLEYLASTLLGVGVDPDVEALTELLIGPLFSSPIGILTLGLAAALGEETIFRGAIQPRFGLLFTAILFALVHSNYGVTLSTLVVFVLGLVLGLVRLRYNTSTSMVVHATYNMSLGLIAYLSLSFLDS